MLIIDIYNDDLLSISHSSSIVYTCLTISTDYFL